MKNCSIKQNILILIIHAHVVSSNVFYNEFRWAVAPYYSP